jgi:hypothetical protein
MTRAELNTQIDADITNKETVNSITPLIDGANRKKIADYIDEQIESISLITGPQGIQGSTGPQGPVGPVGPAGLTWKGAWLSGTSYVEDDAVGHNGASWFCINNTSGTTPPNADATNWALLASQGAQGPAGATGAQGPTGPQGPSSTSATSETITSSQGSAPFTNINKTITLINSSVFPYGLAMPTSLGEVRYVRSLGAATLYSVPNPGNEEFNINFITPEGNGNSIITLQASKVYRFTYLGDFGGELGFWTAEIMNNI